MLPGFPDFFPEYTDGRYSILWAGDRITIYTERSSSRDLAAYKTAIGATKPGHRLLIVAPYIAGIAPLFEESQDFLLLSPFSFSGALPHDSRCIGDAAALAVFINSISNDDKFEIHVSTQWQSATESVVTCTRQILARAAVRLKTIRHFGRLWPVNFRLNAHRAAKYADIAELKTQGKPDALVMAGPSLDQNWEKLRGLKNLWCADTALMALVQRHITPGVVFSIDAGFASREHFVGVTSHLAKTPTILVCDLLGSPGVQRLPFSSILTYASSHPLVQQFAMDNRKFTALENPQGDVGSLMQVTHEALFGGPAKQVLGHDGGQRRRITHARGTAYFSRSYASQNRLFNGETYMLRLSRRY